MLNFLQTARYRSGKTLRVSAIIFVLGLVLAQLLAIPVLAQAFGPDLPSNRDNPVLAQATTTIPDTGNSPYGANFFLDKEVESWKKDKTLQMARDAGIGMMKQEFEWNEIEFKKGYFVDDKFKKSSWQKFDEIVSLAQKYNIQVVARLDRTPNWAKPAGSNPGAPPTKNSDFADFVTAFINHYKGQIHYLQIWNEPNLAEEWNLGKPVNASEYVQLLKTAYEAAKKADPTIKILSAPLAMTNEDLPGHQHLNELTYWKELYQAGIKPYFDIASANGYGLEFAPDDAPAPDKLNFRRAELLHDIMVQNGDTNKSVWFNEYGWDSPPTSIPADKLIWRRVTEQQQADYTVKGIQYAQAHWPWAGVVFIWYFRQVGDIPVDRADYYFQMVTPDFEPKPVYSSVKQAAAKWLTDHNQPTPGPQPLITKPAGSAVPNNVAATPSIKPGDTPVQAIATVAATGTSLATSNSSNTTIVNTAGTSNTPPGTIVAAQNGPTTTVSTASANGTITSNDNGSSPLPFIIGGLLILAAGGGAAYFALGRNRRQG